MASPKATCTKKIKLYRQCNSAKLGSRTFGGVRFGSKLIDWFQHDRGRETLRRTVNVFGHLEGELHASIVWISDGAQVEGAIIAQELIIGGRFNETEEK